jgi:hypothetical protein
MGQYANVAGASSECLHAELAHVAERHRRAGVARVPITRRATAPRQFIFDQLTGRCQRVT